LVDEDWVSKRIAHGLVSGEGLIWHVRDPVTKTSLDKKTGKFEEKVIDSGTTDKRLCVIESEFSSVLRVCRREQNTLSPVMRSAWDSGYLRTLAKNSPAEATGAHVSIIGHITREELAKTLPLVEGFSGFANRFVWLLVRRSQLLPHGGQDLDLTSIGAEIKIASEFARGIGRMQWDQEATDLWESIYLDLNSPKFGGLLAAVTSRAEAQVLRLSLVYALLDRSSVIRPEHLTAAYALWRYSEASARQIFGTSTGDSLADKLLVLIRENPGITRRALRKRVSSTTPRESFLTALAMLRDLGLAHATYELRPKGGRPSEIWHSGGDVANGDKTPEAGVCQDSGIGSFGTIGNVTRSTRKKLVSEPVSSRGGLEETRL
jgi:hypothetical protein